MSLQQAIIDAADTIAMVAFCGGDTQGQFWVEVDRISEYGKDKVEKMIKDLLWRKYQLEV
jgi:hypothetical protein